jgi:hypothetical protein
MHDMAHWAIFSSFTIFTEKQIKTMRPTILYGTSKHALCPWSPHGRCECREEGDGYKTNGAQGHGQGDGARNEEAVQIKERREE